VFGGGSIQLARVRGIRIGVDPSWFIILFLIIWSLSANYYGDLFPGHGTKAFALAVVSALLFFLSVLLHELGHALVALRNGIGIVGIDLFLFGGVAKMQRDSDSPGVEFRVAAAGPAVTLLISAACFAIGSLIASPNEVLRGSRFETGAFGATVAVISYLFSINFLLLVFNLIPGFPLDGGRIARAIAWWRTGDRARATRLAAGLGRAFSLVLMGLGVFLLLEGSFVSGVWLVFIGLFLGGAARQAIFTSRIEGLRVADVMDAEPVAVPEELALDSALDTYFLRYRFPWFPVVDVSGRLVGLVNRESVEGVAEAARPGRTVGSVMASDRDGGSLRVGLDEPLDALLRREGFQRLGAAMAVDRDGVLRGIVTVDRVSRRLQAASTAPS
jgi:Zn-dependent protease